MTTRPRPSILSLFDPLSGSPSSTLNDDSDKENINPPHGTPLIDDFIHSVHQPCHTLPRIPKKRLVDIGDMTLDDVSMLLPTDEEVDDNLTMDLSSEEDEENQTLTFKDMAKAATPVRKPSFARPSLPRTPLGELSIEDKTMPTIKANTYKKPSIFLKDARMTHESSAMEVMQDHHIPFPPPPKSDSDIPILISPPSPLSTSPTNARIEATSSLRPNAPQSSDHTNRLSVDLHTSFQFQLQSPEVTFDLLNDKVSFLNSKDGMDSFMEALEEDDNFSMDLGEAIKPFERDVRVRKHDNSPEEPRQQVEENLQIRYKEGSLLENNSVKNVYIGELQPKEELEPSLPKTCATMSNTSSPVSSTSCNVTRSIAPTIPSVPALRIAKRPMMAVSQPSRVPIQPVTARRVSETKAVIEAKPFSNGRAAPATGRYVPSYPTAKPSGVDSRPTIGPRRILVSQASVSTSRTQGKGNVESTSGSSIGPRRIPATSNAGQRPPSSTVATSGLPKPAMKTGIPRPTLGTGKNGSIRKATVPTRRVL